MIPMVATSDFYSSALMRRVRSGEQIEVETEKQADEMERHGLARRLEPGEGTRGRSYRTTDRRR